MKRGTEVRMIWGWDDMRCYHILVGYLRLGLVLLALFSWMSWMPWVREPTVCFAVSTFFWNESADAEIDGHFSPSLMTFTLSESGKVITWKLPMKSHDSKEQLHVCASSQFFSGSSRQMSASGGGNQDDSVICKCWSHYQHSVTGRLRSMLRHWTSCYWSLFLNLLFLGGITTGMSRKAWWRTTRRARLIDFRVEFHRTFSSEVYCVARTWLWAKDCIINESSKWSETRLSHWIYAPARMRSWQFKQVFPCHTGGVLSSQAGWCGE